MGLKILRVLHAGYVFESGESRIIFDPIFENPFSRNCYAYPNVQFDYLQIKKLKLDAIFISHFHDDHCSLESLQYLDRATPIYLYCIHEELFTIIRELGFLRVHAMRTDEAICIKDFEVIPRLALDSDVDSIFHIKAAGFNILNVVDAWIDPNAKIKDAAWDVVLWPFQTMREIEVIAPQLAEEAELPQEWLDQLKILSPKIIVPSSCQFIQEEWSWYRQAYFPISYARFKKEVEAYLPDSKVQRLNPGVSIELSGGGIKECAPLSWILPMCEQDLDYEYNPNLVPPSTQEIAKHFAPLSDSEKERVFQFCEKEMVKEYSHLGRDLSAHWKLILYDHMGRAVVFCYELNGGLMKRVTFNPITSWITEVPFSKVYAALEDGESLTSMYLRMEGMPFEDIGEDPLISTLFSNDVGSYQKAQLRRLL